MLVKAKDLLDCTQAILEYIGESKENAAIIADTLVESDLAGVPTHGTAILQTIKMRADAGQLTLPTAPEFLYDDGAVAFIDGKDGIGIVAANLALNTAIGKAKQYGVGFALVRNTNNVAALGTYTRKAAKQGVIAVMVGNAAPAASPFGASEAFLGTNPISVGIPIEETGFCLDMATTVVARGKIRKAHLEGKEIPSDWAMDRDGNPTTVAGDALKGCLQYIGGAKGSALAMAIDIIAGVLSGSNYGPGIKSFFSLEGPTGVGFGFFALDISRFMPPEEFTCKMRNYTASVKNLKKAPGVEEIKMPGEIEKNKIERSLREGVQIGDKPFADFKALAALAGSEIKC